MAAFGGQNMSNYSHETVPTQFVEAEGVRFAYRRFGKNGGAPLVFLQYFNASMDDWDPFVTNGFALDHDVILFDNAGVASSGGETPGTVLAASIGGHCKPRHLSSKRKAHQVDHDRAATGPRPS
jgi:pimeloyl-ACP methyl ester carboxylesterase